jgi:hypothetical protein
MGSRIHGVQSPSRSRCAVMPPSVPPDGGGAHSDVQSGGA